MAGFEPANDGVKVHCLTTWRHPKILIYKGGVDNRSRTDGLQSHNLALQPTELYPPYVKMVRQKGFEPLTYCLEGSCSILLSYQRRCQDHTKFRPVPLEQVMGIEPTLSAWKAEVLPLNYTCAPIDMNYCNISKFYLSTVNLKKFFMVVGLQLICYSR